MLRRPVALVVASLGLVLSLMVAAVSVASPVYANNETNPPPPEPAPTPTPTAAAGTVDGGYDATVTMSGTTVEGGSFVAERIQRVLPMCSYDKGLSGAAYYDFWNDDGPAMASETLRDYAYQGLRYEGFEGHQGDTAGYWYGPDCRSGVPGDYLEQYRASHPPVYWVPGDAVPAVQEIEPRLLAEAAYEFVDLPTGTIGWNPQLGGVGATIVNLDTWVWVAGAPTTASVRASVSSGLWAQVDAVLDRVELSAPGADPVTCDEPGVAWTTGATSTPCSIWFTHSSADQPVKDGQDLPTSTLTVTAVWTASWTSSIDPNPTALPDQVITTTAEIPVAEIQTVVTSTAAGVGS